MTSPLFVPDYNTIWSGGWNDMRLYGPMSRHTRRLMRLLTKDMKPHSILDVGCGEGSLLKTLVEMHPNAKAAGIENFHERASPSPEKPSRCDFQDYGYRRLLMGAHF